MRRPISCCTAESLPFHPNGMRFSAFDAAGAILDERVYYSVGGGFVVNGAGSDAPRLVEDRRVLAHPFGSGDELLALCRDTGHSISDLMRANEAAWRRPRPPRPRCGRSGP